MEDSNLKRKSFAYGILFCIVKLLLVGLNTVYAKILFGKGGIFLQVLISLLLFLLLPLLKSSIKENYNKKSQQHLI
ncbi:hypothetical protein [Helicobacter valdiviensis]|nr:hypothetical protein [Helicobacter valdiviensis]